MTQVHGNSAPNTAAQEGQPGLGRLIGAGLILVSLLLLALGTFLGPYRYATSTPGKLTVETCTVDYKYRSSSSSSSRKRTKTRWCYGTFTANDGSTKDLNAELKSDALYTRGHVLQARKSSDTSYQLDQGWPHAIALGCAWAFGALLPLAAGLFFTATGFAFGGPADVRRAGEAASQGLQRTIYVMGLTGVIGLVISMLVVFFT
ncbi:hypothetical protein ABZ848_45395 [Streptomyces sp. NPDC047081]|uniref:hypothetical protein n=1 Tax=Streptomyces sp. NPDC047081 TaxID=3154706 RepID=UPI0033D06AE8